MISTALLDAEAEFIRNGPIGVGGKSFQAADEAAETIHIGTVKSALRKWALGHATFPFATVVAHYQAIGRYGVRHHLPEMLRILHVKTRTDPALASWLPMTFDDDNPHYSSYVGLDHFEQVVRSGDRERVDAFVTAAAIDLALLEIRALAVAPSAPQLARTRAASRVVSQLSRLAPEFELDPSVAAVGAATLARPGADYTDFASCAKPALQTVPEDIRNAVQLTLLPTTRLHDEQMFIRCIQIFEGLYRQVATAISEAVEHLLDCEVTRAVDCLDRASSRLEAVPTLLRVLTTMPPDVFAVIRGFTSGRSAVQSRAFREVEFACTRREHRGPDHHIPKIHVDATLEDAYLELRKWLPEQVHLTEAMLRLDRAWGAMKRGHWGITLKIIGTVPGTGGTAGAAYLQTAAKASLFPALAEAA